MKNAEILLEFSWNSKILMHIQPIPKRVLTTNAFTFEAFTFHWRKAMQLNHLSTHRRIKPSCCRSLGCLLASIALLLGLICLEQPAFALSVSFNFDTTALLGTDARLEFDLFDGDLTPNNSVTISGVATNGTLQGTDCSMGCTGGPPFVLDDTIGLGQLLQDLTLGSALSFDLDLTTNFAGGDSDLLVLNLLDPATNFTLVDTNLDALFAPVPYQDALLVIDLSNGGIQTASATNPPIGVNAVPEPSTLLLLLGGGGPLIAWRMTRKRSRS